MVLSQQGALSLPATGFLGDTEESRWGEKQPVLQGFLAVLLYRFGATDLAEVAGLPEPTCPPPPSPSWGLCSEPRAPGAAGVRVEGWLTEGPVFCPPAHSPLHLS